MHKDSPKHFDICEKLQELLKESCESCKKAAKKAANAAKLFRAFPGSCSKSCRLPPLRSSRASTITTAKVHTFDEVEIEELKLKCWKPLKQNE